MVTWTSDLDLRVTFRLLMQTRVCALSVIPAASVYAGGTVVCGEDGESECDSAGGAQAETCDGLDNDCDGNVDEGFDAPLATLQAGVCEGALKVCGGLDGWQDPDYTSIENYEAEEISCDGLDNDCDGEVDELHSVGGSITYTDVDGTTGLGLGQSCGVGVCGGGVVECGSDGLSLTCSSLGLAGDEICNGADDDCDGQLDEGLDAPAAAFQAGACAGSNKVCGGVSGWLGPITPRLFITKLRSEPRRRQRLRWWDGQWLGRTQCGHSRWPLGPKRCVTDPWMAGTKYTRCRL